MAAMIQPMYQTARLSVAATTPKPALHPSAEAHLPEAHERHGDVQRHGHKRREQQKVVEELDEPALRRRLGPVEVPVGVRVEAVPDRRAERARQADREQQHDDPLELLVEP